MPEMIPVNGLMVKPAGKPVAVYTNVSSGSSKFNEMSSVTTSESRLPWSARGVVTIGVSFTGVTVTVTVAVEVAPSASVTT